MSNVHTVRNNGFHDLQQKNFRKSRQLNVNCPLRINGNILCDLFTATPPPQRICFLRVLTFSPRWSWGYRSIGIWSTSLGNRFPTFRNTVMASSWRTEMSFFFDISTLKMRALRCLETPEIDYPVTWRHFQKERNSQYLSWWVSYTGLWKNILCVSVVKNAIKRVWRISLLNIILEIKIKGKKFTLVVS